MVHGTEQGTSGWTERHFNQDPPFREEQDLYVQFWGKEECKPGHFYGPGIRDLYKIHFIHKGRGRLKVGGHVYELSAGQAFLIYPHVLTYYEADMNEPWTYSWVGFLGAEIEPILNRTRLTPEEPVFPMDWKMMPGLFDQLTMAYSKGEGLRALALKAIFYEFLSALFASAPAGAAPQHTQSKQEEYVQRCKEFVHSHYSEPVTVQQLASELGLDRKYISSLFKESVGVPPQQYLLQFRMNKACELLASGKYSVGEVSCSVGYQDALLFSKMFKKVKGMSPRQFAQQSVGNYI